MVEKNRQSNFELGEIKQKSKYAIDTSSKAAFDERLLQNISRNITKNNDTKHASFVLGSNVTDYQTTNQKNFSDYSNLGLVS